MSIPLCLATPTLIFNFALILHTATLGVRCVWEGWISVEGGPPNLLDDTDDLASSKVSPQQHYIIMLNSHWQLLSPVYKGRTTMMKQNCYLLAS